MTMPAVMRRRDRRFRLWRCERGATIVEFAIVLPVLLLAVIGIIEVAIVLFVSSTIESAVFEASRFGVTGNSDTPGVTREDRVREIVARRTYGLVDMDRVEIDTLVYQTFADIGEPEPFTDTNGNAAYEVGEDYVDVNGNGQWDPDMGAAGLGGPSDVVVYRLTYSWGILTPIMRDVLGENIRNISSVAVRNEPF
jgi:Flp pilus assembly pilin Flp